MKTPNLIQQLWGAALATPFLATERRKAQEAKAKAFLLGVGPVHQHTCSAERKLRRELFREVGRRQALKEIKRERAEDRMAAGTEALRAGAAS